MWWRFALAATASGEPPEALTYQTHIPFLSSGLALAWEVEKESGGERRREDSRKQGQAEASHGHTLSIDSRAASLKW